MPNFDNPYDAQMLLASDQNYTPQLKQCPVILIVDTSSSMSDKMDELNEGIKELKEALMSDTNASERVNIAIVDMGNDRATLDQEFITVPSWQVKQYYAGGVTPMAGAIDLAMEHIEMAKAMYKRAGTSYYRPWLIIFSDGIPTDNNGYFDTNWEVFSNKLANASEGKHLICSTFYIGKNDSDDPNEKAAIKKAKEILYTISSTIGEEKFAYQLNDGPEQLKKSFSGCL